MTALSARIARTAAPLLALVWLLAACGAAGPLTAPYDAGLVEATSAYHQRAGALLAQLEDEGRAAAYADYAPRWAEAVAGADALFVRATANAQGLGDGGRALAQTINAALAAGTGGASADYAGLSLSQAQYYDLRLLVLRWRESHAAGPVSADVWTARRGQLNDAVAAVLLLETARAGG